MFSHCRRHTFRFFCTILCLHFILRVKILQLDCFMCHLIIQYTRVISNISFFLDVSPVVMFSVERVVNKVTKVGTDMMNIVLIDEQFVLVSVFYTNAVVGFGQSRFCVLLYFYIIVFLFSGLFVQDFQRPYPELFVTIAFQAVSAIFLGLCEHFSLKPCQMEPTKFNWKVVSLRYT